MAALLLAGAFVLVLGAAIVGCLINGTPNNMAAAAIFSIALYTFTRPLF